MFSAIFKVLILLEQRQLGREHGEHEEQLYQLQQQARRGGREAALCAVDAVRRPGGAGLRVGFGLRAELLRLPRARRLPQSQGAVPAEHNDSLDATGQRLPRSPRLDL